MKSINIAFPLVDDTDNNALFKTNKTTKDAIKSNLLLLLMTAKGERWFNPEYGTNLRQFLFEPNDDTNATDIKESLSADVATFIPNLTISAIDIIENTDTAVNLLISFIYAEDFFTLTDSVSVRFVA